MTDFERELIHDIWSFSNRTLAAIEILRANYPKSLGFGDNQIRDNFDTMTIEEILEYIRDDAKDLYHTSKENEDNPQGGHCLVPCSPSTLTHGSS